MLLAAASSVTSNNLTGRTDRNGVLDPPGQERTPAGDGAPPTDRSAPPRVVGARAGTRLRHLPSHAGSAPLLQAPIRGFGMVGSPSVDFVDQPQPARLAEAVRHDELGARQDLG